MRILHLLRAILLACWMAFIFLMSAQPDSGAQSGSLLRLLLGPLATGLSPDQFEAAHHLIRKAAHFSEYAMLALLWAWNLGTSPVRLGWAWGLATLFAATDEWHQAFVPTRGPSPWDVAIDSSGALVALSMIRFLVYDRSRAPRSPVSEPVPGVPPRHPVADLPGVLGGDPPGPRQRG